MHIAVCLKWVLLRPEINPLTGALLQPCLPKAATSSGNAFYDIAGLGGVAVGGAFVGRVSVGRVSVGRVSGGGVSGGGVSGGGLSAGAASGDDASDDIAAVSSGSAGVVSSNAASVSSGSSGHRAFDSRHSGLSLADSAALETAMKLRICDSDIVLAITAGPEGANAVLREALAVGADEVVRVQLEADADSARTGAALSEALGGSDLVVCGEWGTYKGSGSVPAFIAHHLGAQQALGCTEVQRQGQVLRAERRLERGRREVLNLGRPAVVSVEASSAQLRRAALPAVMSATQAPIRVVTPTSEAAIRHDKRVRLLSTSAYRPRSKSLPAPVGEDHLERVLTLIGETGTTANPARGALSLDADEAATLILNSFRVWGYPPQPSDHPGSSKEPELSERPDSSKEPEPSQHPDPLKQSEPSERLDLSEWSKGPGSL